MGVMAYDFRGNKTMFLTINHGNYITYVYFHDNIKIVYLKLHDLRSVYMHTSNIPCPADLKTLSSSGVRRGSIPFKRPFLTPLDLDATSDGEKVGRPWKALAEASNVNNKEVRNIFVKQSMKKR